MSSAQEAFASTDQHGSAILREVANAFAQLGLLISPLRLAEMSLAQLYELAEAIGAGDELLATIEMIELPVRRSRPEPIPHRPTV
jgi:hypothetical protein